MSTNAPPPSNPPAGPAEPPKRTCPSCGAQNPPAADHCWQCFARLTPGSAAGPRPAATAAGAPAAVNPYSAAGNPFAPGYTGPKETPSPYAASAGRPGSTPAGTEGWVPTPPPVVTAEDYRVPLPSRRSSGGGPMRIVVIALVAALAGFLGLKLLHHSISIPDTIGGIPKIHDDTSRQVLEVYEKQIEKTGVQADLAVFGTTAPQFFVMLLQGKDPPPIEQNFASLGSVAAGPNAVDFSKTVRQSFAGVDYICVPVTGQVRALCIWQANDLVTIVAAYDRGLADTLNLAVASHDAIVGKG